MLIFYLRPSRKKARAVAIAEALSLLRDLGASAPSGGPLSEKAGIFWITLPRTLLERARLRFPLLGYSQAVDYLQPLEEDSRLQDSHGRPPNPIFWKRHPYTLAPLHREDTTQFRQQAPDRRAFLLEDSEGNVRRVQGYRGSSGAQSRRGLPVEDARILVNLTAKEGGSLLDPFAGAGGIVGAAVRAGQRVFSCDIDPRLRHGLAFLGARHTLADATALPFQTHSFDAVATEPPYDAGATALLCTSLAEMARVVKPGGRIAIYCAATQADRLRETGDRLGLRPFLHAPVDRKGTSCAILAWSR